MGVGINEEAMPNCDMAGTSNPGIRCRYHPRWTTIETLFCSVQLRAEGIVNSTAQACIVLPRQVFGRSLGLDGKADSVSSADYDDELTATGETSAFG
jgi:hypothetical protein